MSFSTANRTQLAMVKESVAGNTPASPAFDVLNYTNEDINLNIGTVQSETIRADRQISDLVRTSIDVSGSIGAEIQAVAYEELLAAALQSAWSTVINFTGAVSIVAATRTVTATGAFTNAVEGQWIKLGAMTNAGNNGWHKILTKTDANEVVLSTGSTTLVDETGSGDETIVGKYIRNGVTTASYTIEKLFNDATTPTYFHFRGAEVSTMELSFETGAILKGSFGFIGRSGDITETAISGATYGAASTNDILDSVNSLGEIKEDDASSASSFQSLNLSLDNNSRGQEAIGTAGYVGIAHGSISLTGSTSIYFEDKATFEKYRDGTPFSLSFVLSSADGDMVITIPKAKFSNMTVVASGINTDVVADAEFTAIVDPTTNCMIQLDVDNVA